MSETPTSPPLDDVFDGIDPYPIWDEGRRRGAVGEIPNGSSERRTYWVLRFEDIEKVLRDHETFSSSINYDTMGPVMAKFMLSMDGQEHRRYRDLVAPAFRASALAKWGEELVEPTVRRLLDAIAPLGRAEL